MQEIKDDKFIQEVASQSDISRYFSDFELKGVKLFIAKRGEQILYQGQTTEYLFYMLSGRAKLSETMPNGCVVLIDFLIAPCFIGEMELLGLREDTLLVQALENCLLLALPFSRYQMPLAKDAKFLRSMCIAIGQKERKKARALTYINAYPLTNRYALFLIETSNDGVCRDRQIDIAQYLGVSSRHLRKVTAEFIQKGYLTHDGRYLRIANYDYLKKLVSEIYGR